MHAISDFRRRCLISIAALVCAAVFPAFPPNAAADIYLYRDESGVYHFTDKPLSAEYQLFIRQWRPPPPPPDRSFPYEAYINEASRLYNLDPHLLKAVARVESNFDPRAVSTKGAVGLMQIMPQNFAVLDISDPYDPRQNILGGARYLREMLDRFQELSLALAAYNAGPGAVERYRDIPPFDETRAYVHNVLRQYRVLKDR